MQSCENKWSKYPEMVNKLLLRVRLLLLALRWRMLRIDMERYSGLN